MRGCTSRRIDCAAGSLGRSSCGVCALGLPWPAHSALECAEGGVFVAASEVLAHEVF